MEHDPQHYAPSIPDDPVRTAGPDELDCDFPIVEDFERRDRLNDEEFWREWEAT
jgi:hypothetical protein